MLRLPPVSSPVRSLVDVDALAQLGTERAWSTLPTFPEACRKAVEFLAAEPAARRVHTLCLRASGELWLVAVGPRGGWRRVWNFGEV
jgi:hypothetical protein